MTDEQASGLLGLGGKLIGSLPAQFLALLAINIVVIGGLLWHLDSQLAARERVLMEIVQSCLHPRT